MLLILGLSVSAIAFEPEEWISGTSRNQDGAISANAGYFYGVSIYTDSTYPVTVKIYNSGTTTTGVSKVIPTVYATSNEDVFLPAPLPTNGLYLDITVSGTTHEVYFYHRDR